MFVLKSPTLPALLTPILALIDYNPDCVKLLRYTNNEHLLIQYKKTHFFTEILSYGQILCFSFFKLIDWSSLINELMRILISNVHFLLINRLKVYLIFDDIWFRAILDVKSCGDWLAEVFKGQCNDIFFFSSCDSNISYEWQDWKGDMLTFVYCLQ